MKRARSGLGFVILGTALACGPPPSTRPAQPATPAQATAPAPPTATAAQPVVAPPRPTEAAPVVPPSVNEGELNEHDLIRPSSSSNALRTADSRLKAGFEGADRTTPKTSIAAGDVEPFETVDALIATLPSDKSMLNHTPRITRKTMERAVEENRNVRVKAWIYAMRYETDQDWHIIAGADPKGGGKPFMNTEVSGLD